jgi:hypothetical protein
VAVVSVVVTVCVFYDGVTVLVRAAHHVSFD